MNSFNRNNLYPTLVLLFSILILSSCSKKETEQIKTINYGLTTFMGTDSNFVGLEIAKLVAERLRQDHFQNEIDVFYIGDGRQIDNVFPLSTDPELPPSAYVFNYANNEGYTIISADFRYEPVLAFNNSGSLQEGDSIPAGMYEWMMHNLENIDLIRNGSLNDMEKIQAAYTSWAYTIDQMQLKKCCIHPSEWTPSPSPCANWDNPSEESVGPLTQTKWGQGHSSYIAPPYDFNYLINSSVTCAGNKPLAGCVSIATVQILKYWSKPSTSYNYSAMYNINASTESQRLIANLCEPTQLHANYGCTETSALSTKVSPTLKNVYGYASGGDFIQYTNSEQWTVRNELVTNRIVYVGGAGTVTSKGFLIFKSTKYSDVHAWLIDGFRKSNINCYYEFWFRMNWGFYGAYDGWYYESNWEPTNLGVNFQYQRTIIKNIHP